MQSQWTWRHIALIVFSIISWFLVGLVINVSITLSSSDWYNVFYRVMGTGDFWMSLLWFVVLLNGLETFLDGTRRAFFYEPRHILQEMGAGYETKDAVGDSGVATLGADLEEAGFELTHTGPKRTITL